MKHKHANRILSRTANHRLALLKGLTSDLLKHGSIITTQARAQELRQFIEPLITEARRDITVHRRRHLLQQLLHPHDLHSLVEVAQASKERPGGYLRLTRLPNTRHDAARMARVDIIDRLTTK